MKTSEKHHRRRLVTAPPLSHPGPHATVLNVECADDEDVEWLWTETPEGRFVSGYQLVPRLKPPTKGNVPPGLYESVTPFARLRR
jgi:hypothetical protein